MTLLDVATSVRSFRKPILSRDAEVLGRLAERLNGSPVPNVRMTERQFVDWHPEGVRAEWVNGEVVLKSTPSKAHQLISGFLYRLLFAFVEYHESGEVTIHISTRLGEQRTLRDPDVLYVSKSRMHLFAENHFEGPPDLTVEVVSPDSVMRDWQTKFIEYQAAGVKEYWVIDPLTKRIAAWALRAGKYKELIADERGNVHSKLLRGFYLRPAWVFKTPLPKQTAILRELGVK